MAIEILCLNFSGPGGRKPGVICDVKECAETERAIWGSAEKLPHFYIIRVPNISLKDVELLRRGQGYAEYDALGKPLFTFRSRFLLDKADLPATAAKEAKTKGYATVDVADIKNAIRCQKLNRLLTSSEVNSAMSASNSGNDPIAAIGG